MTQPVAPTAGARFVGQRVARHEDIRFVTGRGTYVDDIVVAGTLHVAFARSSVARGAIRSVGIAAAGSLPGVVAVLTAADLNHQVGASWVDFEGPPRKGPGRPFRVLADGDVRFVGEPVAMVIAESRYIAEDAVDLIEVDVDPLPAVVDMAHALEPDAPLVHPELGSNIAEQIRGVQHPELDDVFAAAAHVITETYHQHRHNCVPMETHGVLARWDPFQHELTVWAATQAPHGVRSLLARVMGLDDSQIRVIMPDVGGAFGQKMYPLPEEIAVALAARALGRPVKWIEDRRENLMSGQHAREDQVTMSVAVDADGRILAAKADYLECVGSFPAAACSGLGFAGTIFTGPYRIDRIGSSGRSVFTNTTGRCAYRGPWMIETVAREQLLDRVARELGLDPLDVRRRNVLGDDDLPYGMPGGMVLDQVSAAATLEQAAEIISYAELREQQRAWRAEGRLVGIGISLFVEPSGMAMGALSTEAATVRVGPNGRADVVTSGASHGQSLETTIAQVVADELGLDLAHVAVIQGDTATTPFGPGTGGSRSAVITTGAARDGARQVRAKILNIAAQELEADVADLEIEGGRVSVRGTPAKGVTVADIARLAYTNPRKLPPGERPGLEAQSRYTPSSPVTWSNACHICVCEVDRVTGAVTILRYVVSEDCGVMINPNVVEGQIAGGVVQGIGGVLFEQLSYDDEGTPLSTTFIDYLLPTAAEVPVIEYGHIETHAPTNPGGHKGLGEGGAIGAPPAVANAIADALAPLGVVVNRQPLGPADVVALIDAAGA